MYIIFLSGCGTNKCACAVVFTTFIRLRLKRRCHTRVQRVRDYLESVKDFDELITVIPQTRALQPCSRMLRSSRKVSFIELSFE